MFGELPAKSTVNQFDKLSDPGFSKCLLNTFMADQGQRQDDPTGYKQQAPNGCNWPQHFSKSFNTKQEA